MLKSISFLLVVILSIQLTHSQEIKFGKVSKEELAENVYPLDSSANSAILYKKRRTTYNYDGQTGWSLETKIHERIKIYNKEGYDWATKSINLYTDGERESASIKAYTYNLEGNKVTKTKLKNNEIYVEEKNKYWSSKKFTMPDIKEGSIVEWEYTIRSPYFSKIDDMIFQYTIPVKYIDQQISIPEYFKFKYLPNVYYPITINESLKQRQFNFNYREQESGNLTAGGRTVSRYVNVDLNEKIYSGIEQNIPAIKDEPYTSNINNYRSKVSFELTAYTPKNEIPKYYNTTWEDVTKTIYNNSNFGGQLKSTSYFKSDLATLVDATSPIPEKIITIFQFVKNKIKWDNYRGKYTDEGVKKAYQDGTGNVAEINLNLVSMLREAGVNANPILISTRDNGIPLFPTTDGFNYVIAGVEFNNSIILLDASERYSLPNVLPLRVLNWQGRIVREDGSSASINLSPNNFSSEKVLLTVKLDEDGFVTGMSRTIYNNLIAFNYRTNYNSIIEQDLIRKLEKDNQNIEITDFKIGNEEDISKPLTYTTRFEADNQIEMIGNKMYFSPLLHLTKKENPFKLEDRKFPVDFGAPWEEKYTVSIQIPEGYIVESKPENIAYALPDKLGSYKYICTVSGNKIQILSMIQIKSSIISPLNYKPLKEFYKKMIEKQLEKIVLSKQ